MTEQAIRLIGQRFPLKRRDPGEYAAFKASPLALTLDWYEAEGLGNVSVLHGKAMGGLMKMDTLVINATGRDMPLFSYDYISAMGSHTLLVEYYDTMLAPAAFDASALEQVKASAAALPDNDLGAHWYDPMKLPASLSKKTKKRDLPQLETTFLSALTAYLFLAAEKEPIADPAAKRERAAAYVNGLLEKGGPSTDAFAKSIGKDRTRDLFTRIVFGTEA